MVRSLFASVVVVIVAGMAQADDSTLKVKVGDKFPTVDLGAAQIEKALPDAKDAKTVSIADLKGKTVVIFFYPKASTPGCTVESCGFRDIADKFPKGTVVIGASADKEAAQDKFIKENKLPFALLCDTDLKLIKRTRHPIDQRELPATRDVPRGQRGENREGLLEGRPEGPPGRSAEGRRRIAEKVSGAFPVSCFVVAAR